jgi:peptidoglycan/xylan/chitin deacetylase (PgdA/CDA1 family)
MMRRIILAISMVAASLCAIGASPANAGEVAITFDDLPVFGLYAPMPEAQRVTAELLDGFKLHHWKVTGFVNEIQLAEWDRPSRIDLLNRWLDAGMDLGNHSYSHLSLTSTPVDAYIADVARGETVTKTLLAQRGRHERWYRHPYLETGPTLAIRQQFEGWLAAHGYQVAPVSMENSDWVFAEPYDEALKRGDTAAATHIRDAYLTFTRQIIPWYRAAAKDVLGREPAFVFLLHASRLNAVSIDALDTIFQENHLHSITLDKAMTDPAYRIPDTYAGPAGMGWVTRWSIGLHMPIHDPVAPKVPDDIAAMDTAAEAAISKPPASVAPGS